MNQIIAQNKEHLLTIIREHMKEYGYCCDLNHIDVSNITDMSHLFYDSDYCGGYVSECLFNGNISNWDVSNVKYMSSMFYKSKFTGDLSLWNINEKCYIGFQMFGESKYPKDGILFWYHLLTGHMFELSQDQKCHYDEIKPILNSLELSDLPAAKYLHETFTGSLQNQEIIICNDIINL